MLPTSKPTKRQKKGLAFRERKRGKDKLRPLPGTISDSEDEIDVPAIEDQIVVDPPQSQQGHQASEEILFRKGKTRAKAEEVETEARVVVTIARKSKRKAKEEDEIVTESDKPKSKRKRVSEKTIMPEDVEDGAEDGESPSAEVETKTKQRFILFLGNLRYTTTPEVIQAHFSACIPPPTVRLLTPKPSAKFPTKPVTKSRGCAFLEFKHRGALQQGLKLHHSQLDGRQINVELTAGGGGKGAARLEKLKERNKELEGQRRKRQDPTADTPPGARRFSDTSGEREVHTHKRTWTVENVEERRTHRGGQKHQRDSKKRGPRVKDFRTGVNAIPVG